MSFQELLANTLTGDLPIALIGDHEATDPLWEIATSLGFRLAKIDARNLSAIDAAAGWDRKSKAAWLVVVENCHLVPPSATPGDPRENEDALLDLAFDGDPSFPANTTLVLSFAEPTELSEALADDAIPCAMIAPDAPAEPVKAREPLRIAA